MKTILVPTDFSEISKNAINYAAELAKALHAKIILLHAFHVPVVTTDVIVVSPALDEIEQFSNEQLNKIRNEIIVNCADLVIECKAIMGFAANVIDEYTKDTKVDLIIMGMNGAGYITEKLIGNLTSSLLLKSNCPVMAIDENVKFTAIKKIVFASDYKALEKSLVTVFREFAALLNSSIYILNIVKDSEMLPDDFEGPVVGIKLDQAFEGLEHSFHFSLNQDIVKGINDFVAAKQIDMVVMVPRKHSFINKLLHEPNTKRMAFHANVPLLALHN